MRLFLFLILSTLLSVLPRASHAAALPRASHAAALPQVGYAAALPLPTAQPNDTLAIDSTYAPLPQRNFNALDYSLDAPHYYRGDSLAHRFTFLQLGGGRMAINDTHRHDPDPLYLMHLRLGRQFNTVSSLRLGVEGALGFIPQAAENTFYNSTNARIAFEADYLYSLSSHLLGYRPDRLLDVSAMVGIGGAYSKLFRSDMDDWSSEFNTASTSIFGKAGFQFKFLAGPQAALAIEPYVMASTRGIDLVRSEHEFYSYRMGWGFDIAFIQYFGNHLTPTHHDGDFRRHYTRRQRFFAGDVPSWLLRRPLFAGMQTGVAGVSGDGRTFNKSAGVGQRAYIGWWMSPAIGIRALVGFENMKWQENEHASLRDFISYRHGALSLLVNPFGLMRRATYAAPVGITLLAGYEGGWAAREEGRQGFPAFGYHLGANLWLRLTDGLKLTVEPQYTVLTHKNDASRASIDNLTRASIGLEFTFNNPSFPPIASQQNVSTPFGLQNYFIGISGGRNFTPRYYQDNSRVRDYIKSALLTAGYEYTPRHTLRLSAEYMTDVFYANHEYDRQHRVMATIGYQHNLLHTQFNIQNTKYKIHRPWALCVNIGPTIAFGGDKPVMGLNGGAQLSYRLSTQFSLFLAENLYWIPSGLWNTDQNTELNITSSWNLGLMYHFESLVRPTVKAATATAAVVATAATATGHAIATAATATGHAIATAATATGRAVATVGTAMTDQREHPVFVDYAMGYHHFMHMPTTGSDPWEPELQLSAGWWALPAAGLRIGGDFLRGYSGESEVKTATETFTRYDKIRLSYVYADLMVNPLGFARQYNWDSKAGIVLIGGRTLVNLNDGNMEKRYWNNGWRLGTQLWARIAPGLRVHVEPMFSLFDCNQQSDNPADYTGRDHRELFSLKAGLTMLLRNGKEAAKHGNTKATTDHSASNQAGSMYSHASRWAIGLGGGLHFNKDDYRLSGSGTNSNLQALVSYQLWTNTKLTLSEELTFDHFIDPCTYRLTAGPDAGEQRSGRALTTYRYLFSSLAYEYDILGLFNGDPRRRWSFNILGGVCLSYYLNESSSVPGESADHEVAHSERNSPINFNSLIGASVSYRLSSRLSVYYHHHLFTYSFSHPYWVHYTPQLVSRYGHINTFNIGLMLHL